MNPMSTEEADALTTTTPRRYIVWSRGVLLIAPHFLKKLWSSKLHNSNIRVLVEGQPEFKAL